jgi:aminomethyltransferase
MLKQTPLNALHRRLGAKMVDFGGWDMPLHYGSQIEEHHQVRRDAGMFDVSHMRVVDLKGGGARDFLRGLLANNVDKLKLRGKALYGCMLNERAGVIDDLITYFLAEDWFRLVVNAATADKDIAWMLARRDERSPGLGITPRTDLAMIAVQGPNARARVWQALPEARGPTEKLVPFQAAEAGEYFLARTGYTGEDGFELIVPVPQVAAVWEKLRGAGVVPAGLGARDTLRLEAGMNLYGQDMDETVSPLESGLAWTVDLDSPRDFIGKPALLRQPPVRQLVGLVLLDRGVLRAHQRVDTEHGGGEVTSGTFSPSMQQSIALARVPQKVGIGEEAKVEVRDKLLHAKVVKPPFVRNGKVLI